MLISAIVLSLTFNVAVLAADSVRDAIIGSIRQFAGSYDGPDRKNSRPTHPSPKDDRLRELELQNDDLKRRNTGLDSDNRSLLRTRDALDTSLADERALRRTITEKGTDITQRITQRTTRGIAANFGSMAAEAVPYVGMAVIVGVTYYEVRDACLTMSDMRELSNLFEIPAEDDSRYCGFTLQEFRDTVFEIKSEVDCSSLNMPPEMVAQCQEPPKIDNFSPFESPVLIAPPERP